MRRALSAARAVRLLCRLTFKAGRLAAVPVCQHPSTLLLPRRVAALPSPVQGWPKGSAQAWWHGGGVATPGAAGGVPPAPSQAAYEWLQVSSLPVATSG